MVKVKAHCMLAAVSAVSLLFATVTYAQTSKKAAPGIRDRIAGSIDDSYVTPLPGSQHPAAKTKLDQGRIASDTRLDRMTIVFKLSDHQQQALETLLQEQQNRASANYHKWLSPAEYGARFGISDSDLSKAKAWLQAQGLTVNEDASDRTMVVFSGTASQVEAAFHTELHQYISEGETHFANATDLALPASLTGIVLGVRSLNDFRPHPQQRVKQIKSNFTSNISGSHFLAPDDFATIYNVRGLYNNGIDGTGQKIAVMGQTDIVMADIRAFRKVSGLSASDPQVVLVPGATDPGVKSGDIDEANLDLDWAGAVARGAMLIYVNSSNALDSLQYAIQQDLAPVISISYGNCEQNIPSSETSTLNALFKQANSQGQTIVAAAGDSGAADCDFSKDSSSPVTSATHGLAVDFPPSSPNVTGVGGSEFNEGSATFWNATNNANNGSAISYIPEIAWNDTSASIANGGSLSASGGGASIRFLKPSWQTGTGIPADGARDVPDITLNASADHDGYLVCSRGSCVNGYRAADTSLKVFGGTSAGAPTFAGLVALLNQETNSAQGNINPAIYALAATSTNAIHDIVSGDNKVPCTAGKPGCPNGGSIGFTAGVGYDLVTGLGSVNALNFVTELAAAQGITASPDFQLNATNATFSLARGNSTTDALTVSALNGFSGTVALTCTVSSALTNTTCSVSPSSVTGSGASILTVKTSVLAAGNTLPPRPFESGPLWASSSLGLFAIFFAPLWKRKRVSRGLLLTVSLIAVFAFFSAGCGGGSAATSATPTSTPSATAGVSGVITVQGTSGALSHSVQVAVTVN